MNSDNRRKYQKEHKLKTKNQLMNKLGRCCKKCKFSNKDALQFDHINNDGYKDKQISKQGAIRRKYRNIYHLSKLFKDDNILFRQTFQLLCANCNQIKELKKRRKLIKSTVSHSCD